MAPEYRAERNRPVDGRAWVNFVLAAILLAGLTIPTVAWGADPQQQWAGGDQQGLVFTGLKMVGALALILGLILLSLHFLKRWRSGVMRRSPGSQVQILDVRMLAPKKSVALVEVDGTRLLLGVGTETVTMLSRIDSQPHQVGEEPEERASGFAKTLAHILRRRPPEDSEVMEVSANPVQLQGSQVGLREKRDAEEKQLTMLK